MKRYPLLAVFIMCTMHAYSQDQHTEALKSNTAPGFFLGTGTGINNFNAILGLYGEARIYNNLTLAGGGGIGLWGTKVSGALHYYLHYPFYTYFGLGISYAGGIDTMLLTLIYEEETIYIRQHPLETLNLTAGFHFKLSSNLRGNFEIGYGIRLRKDPYEAYNPPHEDDFDETLNNFMGLLTPGGLILGISISYGI